MKAPRTERHTFRLRIEWFERYKDTPMFYNMGSFRFGNQGYAIHRLGVNGTTIHDLVKERISNEFLEWLDDQGMEYRFGWEDITIYGNASIFAFKMWWSAPIDAQ